MDSPTRYERRSINVKEFSQKIGPSECFVIMGKELFGGDVIIAICNVSGKIKAEKIKLPK